MIEICKGDDDGMKVFPYLSFPSLSMYNMMLGLDKRMQLDYSYMKEYKLRC